MNTRVQTLLVAAIPLGIWGWAYEYSFFKALGLNSNDYIGIEQFIFTGLKYSAIPLLALIAFSLLKKFFTSAITKDDWEDIDAKAKELTFSGAIANARLGFLICLGFWILVAFSKIETLGVRLGIMFIYASITTLGAFIPALYMSTKISRPAIHLAFIAAIALCFSAGGLDAGRFSQNSIGILRDDSILKIESINGEISVTTKPIPTPSHIWDKFENILASSK